MVIEINPNPPIPALQRVDDRTKIDVRYALISPYANAHIHWDKDRHELVYEIEEPVLDEKEAKTLEKLESAMLELININVAVERTHEHMLDYIDKTMRILIDELSIKVSPATYEKVYYYLYRDFIGLNEIEPLLRDYFIEDIECNGYNTPVYVVHRVFRNIRTNLVFPDIAGLANFVEKLAQRAGKYVSYADPLLDGSLPDGSRVNASYTKDVTSRGPTFTIRKFTKVPWTPTQLISLGTVSPEMLAYFWLLIQYKSNIFITGGTASGKTTLLNALAFFIPPEARVVSIEDTRELNLPRENWVPAVARIAIGTGSVGEIDLFDLLKNSFRQNPDYVIVGEVRGREAFVLFQGMASGHPSISTMHADSVDSMIRRLQTPPIELSPTLVNALDAVAIMTHAIVKKKETRRLREVSEILGTTHDGEAKTNSPFVWDPSHDKFKERKKSHALEQIAHRYGISLRSLKAEFRKRAHLLENLYKNEVFGFEEVKQIINDYYENPEAVRKRFKVR